MCNGFVGKNIKYLSAAEVTYRIPGVNYFIELLIILRLRYNVEKHHYTSINSHSVPMIELLDYSERRIYKLLGIPRQFITGMM